ncbi:ABC transporter permease [Arcanobacterium haemolyticum]|nr:ABC transporter permease [Arcanobacterium haemolyticum]
MTALHVLSPIPASDVSPQTAYLSRQAASPWHGFIALTGFAFWKHITNVFSLVFAVAIPVFMYLMFGPGQEYSDVWTGRANVAATVLVSMAAYGMIISTSMAGTNLALERSSGVARLFALTPVGDFQMILSRIIAAMFVNLFVMAIVYAVGYTNGASMYAGAWLASFGIIVALALLPAAIGVACACVFRSDAAFSVSSAVIFLSCFASGMFIPIDQMGEFWANLAPWTPTYGIVQMTHLPLYSEASWEWSWMANYAGWLLIFAAIATIANRRHTTR